MPKLFDITGYAIYFWANEGTEPIHVHISKKIPQAHATKIWLTSTGKCVLANNNSNIKRTDLDDLMESIEAQFFYICGKWKDFFNLDKITFYC